MSTSTPANLPTLDEWMGMRGKLVTVLGDQPAKTLLSVLAPMADGGFASNARLDVLEIRTNARFDQVEASTTARLDQLETHMKVRFDQVEARTTARLGQLEAHMNARFELAETRTNARFDQAEASVAARFDQAEVSVAARFDQVATRFDVLERCMGKAFERADERLHSEVSGIRKDMGAMRSDLVAEITRSASDNLKSMRGMFFQLAGLISTVGAIVIAASRFL